MYLIILLLCNVNSFYYNFAVSKTRIWLLILLSVSVLCISSCRNSDFEVPFWEEEHPDITMKNASYTVYKTKTDPIRLSAEIVNVYSDQKKTTFENVSFAQNDKDNVLILTGSCDRAACLDNSKISLYDNIILEKKDSNTVISCNQLNWDNTSGDISASDNIIVSYSDSTSIAAESFKSNLNKNFYSFEKITDASFKTSDDSIISVACDSLTYDRDSEMVLSENWITIKEGSRKITLSGARLEYDKNQAVMTVSMQAKFSKETDNGLLSCTAQNMVYNTDEQILTIIGNAHITWDTDSYKASAIIINLDTEEIRLLGPISGVIYG